MKNELSSSLNSNPSTSFCLSDVFVYRVTGNKAASFLHGQLSQAVSNQKPGTWQRHAFFDLKGKILCELFVFANSATDYLVCGFKKGDYQSCLDHLQKIAPLSRVTLTQESSFRGIELFELDPNKILYLKKILAEFVSPNFCFQMRANQPFYLLLFATETQNQIIEVFAQKGLEQKTKMPQEYQIAYGHTLLDDDFLIGKHFASEVFWLDVLNYEKGCYRGQEIVARLHFRGQVTKKIFPFLSKNEASLFQKENDVLQNEAKVGEIICSNSINNNQTIGLVWVQLKKANLDEPFYLETQKNFKASLTITNFLKQTN